MMFIGVFLILIGVLMILKPNFIWNMCESWKSSDATEPSRLYIYSIRFGGIMLILVGLASIIIYYIK